MKAVAVYFSEIEIINCEVSYGNHAMSLPLMLEITTILEIAIADLDGALKWSR